MTGSSGHPGIDEGRLAPGSGHRPAGREYGRADYSREAYDAALTRFRDKYANTPVQELTGLVTFKEVG